MSERDHAVAWFVFFGLVLLARLLITRPALRILRPWISRLGEWGSNRLNTPEEVDPEVEELAIIRRRQQLHVHIERLRRILATDEAMSATRQLGNRLAYAWLLDELERTPDLLPVLGPSRSPSLVSRGSHAGSTVEILDVGWRS